MTASSPKPLNLPGPEVHLKHVESDSLALSVRRIRITIEAQPRTTLWSPLLVTPAHPEYPSGHSTTSSAAATVLAHFFGEQTSFTVDSNVMLGVTRSFTSFSAAQDEIADARILGGIHFRSACEDGRATGEKVANYVLEHTALVKHG